jgi:hypothetical protein
MPVNEADAALDALLDAVAEWRGIFPARRGLPRSC